jgi:hypothetical protein
MLKLFLQKTYYAFAIATILWSGMIWVNYAISKVERNVTKEQTVEICRKVIEQHSDLAVIKNNIVIIREDIKEIKEILN